MKFFLLTAGDNYYPRRGTGDWIATFETLEEAEAVVTEVTDNLADEHYTSFLVPRHCTGSPPGPPGPFRPPSVRLQDPSQDQKFSAGISLRQVTQRVRPFAELCAKPTWPTRAPKHVPEDSSATPTSWCAGGIDTSESTQ